MLTHRFDHEFQIDGGVRHRNGYSFAAERVGFTVEFLHQEVQLTADGASPVECSSHFFNVSAKSFHFLVDVKFDTVERDFLTDALIDFFFGDLSTVCQRGA